MSADVCKFMQKAEPEIVDAVIAQSEPDHWCAVGEPECRAVEISFRQMGNHDERNTMLGQELLRQARRVIRPAQPGELSEEIKGHRAGLVGFCRPRLISIRQHLPAPGLKRVRVHFGIRPRVVVLAIERSPCDIGAASAADEFSDQLLRS